MLRALWVLSLAAGCGRVGFDLEDLDEPNAPSLASTLPCDVAVEVATGTTPPSFDFLAWVRDGAGEHVVGSVHLGPTTHPLLRYRVRIVDGVLALVADGTMFEATDPWSFDSVRIPGGTLAAYVDTNGGAFTVRARDGLQVTSGPSLVAPLSLATSAFVRLRDGTLVLAGQNGTELHAYTLDATTGAVTRGPYVLAVDNFNGLSTFVATDTGLAAAWVDAAGDCKVLGVDSDLATTVGPVTLDLQVCFRPRIAWSSSRQQLAVLTPDTMTDTTAITVLDAGLGTVLGTTTLVPSASEGVLASDGEDFWAVTPTLTNLEVFRVGADLLVDHRTPSVTTMYRGTSIDVRGGTPVVLWADGVMSTFARRLCR